MKRLVVWIGMASVAAMITGCVFDPRGLDGICGNGIREGAEECDGTDLGGATCESLGLGRGTVVCSPSCTLVTDGCSGPNPCGNGRLDPGEACDGTNLAGATCESLGYDGGTLACTDECTYDARGCTGGEAECGNGILEEGEECDDGTANSDTEPDACRTDCTRAHCGDGVKDSGEECDGTDFGGLTCEGLGQPSGYLLCTQSCTISTDGCTGIPETCGNGTLDAGEECDAGDQNSLEPNAPCRPNCTLPSCGDGIHDDQLGEECDAGDANANEPNAPCRSDCTLPSCGDGITDDQLGEECDDGTANSDTEPDACRTDCTHAHCGDGVTDTGEECDDGTANSDTEPDACRTDCTRAHCGDGVKDSGEECDGTDLGSITSCTQLEHDPPYHDSVPTCDASCHLTGCHWCGDGVVDRPWEVCDPPGDMEWGSFHGRCTSSCGEMRLVDQVDYDAWVKSSFLGIAVMPPHSFAVAGRVEQNDSYYTRMAIYDPSGTRTVTRRGNNDDAYYMDVAYSDAVSRLVFIGSVYDDHGNTSWDVLLEGYDANGGSRQGSIFSSTDGSDRYLEDVGMRVGAHSHYIYWTGTWKGDDGVIMRIDTNNPSQTTLDELMDRLESHLASNGWIYEVVPRALTIGSDGVYVGGMFQVDYENSNASDNYDGFVAKYGFDLSLQWVSIIGDPEIFEEVEAIEEVDGVLYVGGVFEGDSYFPSHIGSYDAFLLPMEPSDGSFDPDDALVWGSYSEDFVQGMGSYGSKVYVVGFAGGGFDGISGHGGYDAFLCVVDVSGGVMSDEGCRLFGTGYHDGFYDVGVGYVNGVPALLIPGSTRGAWEPGITKVSNSNYRNGVVFVFSRTDLF